METSSSEARLDLYTDNTFSDGEPVLAGNITVSGTAGQSDGQGGREFNTLDEPISHTIKRDLGAVGTKFAAVLWPKEKGSLLREWDLWGPLILCTLMATILQGHGDEDNKDGNTGDGGPQFAEVFVIVWVGAMIVTLNTKLLGETTYSDVLTIIYIFLRRLHFILPICVCARLLPAATGSVPGSVSDSAAGDPEHSPLHSEVTIILHSQCCQFKLWPI